MTTFQVFANTFPLHQTCTALSLPANWTYDSCSFTTVTFYNLLAFYFPFCLVQTLFS